MSHFSRRLATIGTDIGEAARILRSGGLVAIPTETVYGLAANAFDTDAVLSIFRAKQRPSFDPLIVHIGRTEDLPRVAAPFAERRAQELTELLTRAFWPGPLTLILPRTDAVADVVTSGLPHVGVRMPRHPLTLQLLRMLPFPLAAPSANPFGYISPTTAAHVQQQLGERVQYILDGGEAEVGVESTIVAPTPQGLEVLRLGGVSIAALEAMASPVSVQAHSTSNPRAPGMLSSHYAPRKPLVLGHIPVLVGQHEPGTFRVLGYSSTYGYEGEVLSLSANVDEAAHRLFAALRELDSGPHRLIIAEEVPNEGLGAAINDRLRRAAWKG